ncbi:MAG: type II toxin-antitoxin system HicA family toxin [Spirochaetales bacterium]|nr:type II toxin-antitoxin system HicA family toxin [Spirochaetales bacterium]
MKHYSSRELIRLLESRGWYEVACVGDHHQYKHPILPGRITVPHPRKDVPIGTARNILKAAGIDV